MSGKHIVSAITGLVSVVAFLLSAASTSARRPLKVAFVGDPQADGLEQLGYVRKSIYKELRERKDLDLVVLLGDLVNNDVSLLPPSKASLDSMSCPWFSVPGNHDGDLNSFRKIIGYVDTTFVMRNVRFILMNDVRHGRHGYEGGFTENQKAYLDSVLKATPSGMKAVVSVHIPFSEFKAQDSLSAIFSHHPDLLLMCGHTHMAARHRIHGVEEVWAGASCGMFWTGAKGPDGLPDALMNCGAPRGYYVATFNGKGNCSLEYKCVGRSRKDMATAYLADDDSRLVVNVFGGSEDGTVEVKIPGMKGWIEVPRKKMPAVETLKVIEYDRTIPRRIGRKRNPEYSPMRTMDSPHIWSVSFRNDSRKATALESAAGRKLRIRYKDPSMDFSARVILNR